MNNNNLKKAPLFIIAITSLIGSPNIALAHPQECADVTAPTTFIGSAGIVCLETIKVTDSSGTQIYKAALQSLAPEQPNSFRLISAEADNRSSEANSPTYNPNSGELTLPTVDIPQTFGTERYSASLIYKPDTNLFELTTANIFIHPDYIPNQTWKPYGMLDLNERRSVDLLGRSIPYAKLANAVYDFNNVVVSWTLVELHENDSGMQAGLYHNNISNELVLAFRGTEACEFPCSLSETTEISRDLRADTLLTFGGVHEQFDDAFSYAQDVLNRSEGRKIIVTGHSLGGSLAQAIGASLGLETFAFNSAPVPEKFFDDYPSNLTEQEESDSIYVLADIHDPVSNTDEAKIYSGSSHVGSLIQFDFNTLEILPAPLDDIDALRVNKHGMEPLIESALALLAVYSGGW